MLMLSSFLLSMCLPLAKADDNSHGPCCSKVPRRRTTVPLLRFGPKRQLRDVNQACFRPKFAVHLVHHFTTTMAPVIILTGASRGLGLSILQLLLKAGARVVTLSRSKPDALVQLQEQYKDQLEVVQGDAASVEDNAGVVKAAVDRWGGIDGVVVNAGTIEPSALVYNPAVGAALMASADRGHPAGQDGAVRLDQPPLCAVPRAACAVVPP